MQTLIFEVSDNEKAKALKQVAKALGISLARTSKKAAAKRKEDKPYNPEFVAKIEEGRRQIREGKVTVIKTEDLWK